MSAPVRKHFGTDGVRGRGGETLTAPLALSIGAAATLEVGGERPRVLVIRDTRESGAMLESALAAGIASAGGRGPPARGRAADARGAVARAALRARSGGGHLGVAQPVRRQRDQVLRCRR